MDFRQIPKDDAPLHTAFCIYQSSDQTMTICTDKMLIKAKSKQKDVSWKNLSLSIKYADLIENTPFELWIPEEMENITKIVSPFVTELKINQLQAMRDTSFEKKHQEVSSKFSRSTISASEEEIKDSVSVTNETSESKYEFPFQDCHHVDLSVLRTLVHLNSLTIEILPPKLSCNYHTRYFNFSYLDMQNLARGISELKNLQIFKLRRSRMDSVKLSTILDGLQWISVEYLEFYFCQLNDDCGESLYEYLVSTKSLKHLDLSGNYFKQEVIEYLSKGLQASSSHLEYLCLSNNPFNDESLYVLTKTLESYEYLKVLKLSGIQCSEVGTSGIVKLVKNNSHLVELYIIAVQMNGTGLIDALKKNHTIQQIYCQGCGLTLDEEFKIEVLLKRNQYIKANPYIGDVTKTEEEINAFIMRTKNPIFIKTLKEKKDRTQCSQNRSLKFVDANISKSFIEEEE
ncbi:uncharacterized protein LOC129912541 [Episyrphus balteatus]|uniref:uncharacterized protein LOC129912541 n=1 Tax=Episyrphus balteatus TaxID=286459 RepID=UPI0024851C4D|nr:uncharacterized protein LOC129912541 [Episyrphus balteatus]